MVTSWRVSLLIAVALLTGCGAESPASSGLAASTQIQRQAASEPAPTPIPSSRPRPTPTPMPVEPEESPEAAIPDTGRALADDNAAPAPTALPQPSVTPNEPTQQCVRLTDFAIEAGNLAWFVVNDNVMGGRSIGGPTFDGSTMVFDGEINTDGGGFSSVRVELGADALTGLTEIQVRARTDGRAYKLTLEDSLASRDRRVSQQGSLAFSGTSDWQTATVSFAGLEPRIFGRAVQAEAFRPDLATQLGIMISDGVDGPFRIEIDWIDACA